MTIDHWKFGDAVKSISPPRIISILAFPLPSKKETLTQTLLSVFCLIGGHFPLTALMKILVSSRIWPMISWWQVQSGREERWLCFRLWIRSHPETLNSESRNQRARLWRFCECCIQTLCNWIRLVTKTILWVIYLNWIGNPTWHCCVALRIAVTA